MAFVLSNLLQQSFIRLGQANISTATGGATTSVVDSKQVGLHGDNAWKDGACIIIRDVAGLSAAPETEIALVTAYPDSTGTFTSAIPAFIHAQRGLRHIGQTVRVVPLQTLRELANSCL